MRICFAVFLLIGLATAENAWRSGQVYTYNHTDKVKIGFPEIETPLTPSRLSCKVQLQPTTPNTVFAQLVDLEHRNETVSSPVVQKILGEPFALKTKDGVVSGLEVHPQLPRWAINIVKAKMGVLSLNLHGVPMYGMMKKTSGPNAQSEAFTVYEEHHFGICETEYTISPLPKHLPSCEVAPEQPCMTPEIRREVEEHLLVTKTVDFHKCKTPNTFTHSMPPTANLREYAPVVNSLYTRVTTTQYVIHGDRSNHLIKSLYHHEKVALNPLRGETEKVLLETLSMWQLEAVKPAPRTPRLPFSPKIENSLVAVLVPEHSPVTESVTVSPLRRLMPQVEEPRVIVSKVMNLLQEISREVEIYTHNNVSSKILTVVEGIKFLDLPQIEELLQHVQAVRSPVERETMKQVLLDAVVLAGTNPCVKFIKDCIVRKIVQGERAAMLIMTLPMTIRSPTSPVLRELLQLVEQVERKESLYTTAVLALSNVIYHHCVEPSYIKAKPVRAHVPTHIIPYCKVDTPEVVAFVRHLAQKLRAREETAIKVAVVKALANTAHPQAIKVLEPVCTGVEPQPEFIRVQAIASLRRAAVVLKKEVTSILLAIFHNLEESHEPRIAAASVILVAEPTYETLLPLSLATWYEPSQHVRTFIYTALKTMAVVKEPVKPVVNLAAKAALAMCKPAKVLVPYSVTGVYADAIRSLNVGSVLGVTHIGSTKSHLPTLVMANLLREEGKPYVAFESSLATEGVQELIEELIVPAYEQIKSSVDASIPPRFRRSVSAKSLHKQFGKITEAAEANATVWFRVNDVMERAFTIGAENNPLNYIVKEAMELSEDIKQGARINFQKTVPLVDTEIVLPTELGYLACIQISLPVTVSVRGEIQGRIGQPTTLKAALKPLITAKYVSKLSVFSNLTESVAESGVVAHAQVGAPVQLEVEIEPRTKEAKLAVKQHPEYVNKNITAVHYQAAPYTVYEPIRELITPVECLPSFRIQKQETVRNITYPLQGLKKAVGICLNVTHQSSTPLESLEKIQASILSKIESPLSLVNFPYYATEEILNFNNLTVVYSPEKSEAKELRTLIKYFPSETEVTEAPEEIEVEKVNKYKSSWSLNRVPSWNKPRSYSRNPAQTPLNVRVHTPVRAALEGKRCHNLEVISELVGPRTPRKAGAIISVALGPDTYHGKVEVVVAPVPELIPEPYKIVAEGTVAQHEKEVHTHVQVNFAPEQEQESQQIKLKMKLNQTEELQAIIAESPKPEECYQKYGRFNETCKQLVLNSTSMNCLKAQFEYEPEQLPAPVMKAILGAESFIQYVLYPYMTKEYIPKSEGPKPFGLIDVEASYSPRYNVCTIELEQGQERTIFKNISVPLLVKEVIALSHSLEGLKMSANKLTSGRFMPTCVVKNETLKTFDGVNTTIANLPNGKYVLLAKHIAKENSPAVMLKKTPVGKAVKIALGQTVIEVLPEPSARQGYEVLVNGRQERLTRNQPIQVRNITGEVIAEVVPEPEKAIKVKFLSLNTGIFVYVYGEEVKVEVPPTFKARTTGICGNNNGEKFDELMTGLKKVNSSKIQKYQSQIPQRYSRWGQKEVEQPRWGQENPTVRPWGKQEVNELIERFQIEQ